MIFEPFKVEIVLGTPTVINNEAPMLDSIIAWCNVMANNGDLDAQNNLPLEKKKLTGKSYWAASRFFYKWMPSSETHLSKRIDYKAMERFSSTKLFINPSSGVNKTYHEKIMPLHIEKAVAFGVGDVTEIDEMLSRLTHFGSMRRSGYGRIIDSKAIPFEHDWSQSVDGLLTRPVPVASGEKSDAIAGFKPPYWDKTQWAPVQLPEAKIPGKIFDIL